MRNSVDRAYLAGWSWSSQHGNVEATIAQADALLRGIGLSPDPGHTDAFCSGSLDNSRGDRWRLDYLTRGT